MSRHRIDTSIVYTGTEDLPEARPIENPEVEPVPADNPPKKTVEREPYLPDAKLVEAVNLAIALGRPLLLQGDPGCGKTRLAYAVAYTLGLPLEECYIKSTSRAQDLLYTYDAVKRLFDAQLGSDAPRDEKGQPLSRNPRNYVTLGPIGRAIVRAQYGRRSVILIDEIDKADIDFPNDLLLELDRLEFQVAEVPALRFAVPADRPDLRPIVFVTHNEEKALPTAFLRRCIFQYLEFPENKAHLARILDIHQITADTLGPRAIDVLLRLRQVDLTKKPGLSELLDWVGYMQAVQTPVETLEQLPYIGVLLKQHIDQQRVMKEFSHALMNNVVPEFLWILFKQLRRRHFPVGIDDFNALQTALEAGFGWSSQEELRDLCTALWAKSKREQAVLGALFEQLEISTWLLPETDQFKKDEVPSRNPDTPSDPDDHESKGQPEMPSAPVTKARGGLPPIPLEGIDLPKYHFVFVPQFPLTYREVAQAWRRLRHPIRTGPPVELDVEATVERRSRTGIASDIVLVPRRRNTARLLLLVDRQGSMAPFHAFVDDVCTAIRDAGNLENVALFYFHDTLVEGADESLLETLPEQLFPMLDPILTKISPLSEGFVYEDCDLLSAQPVDQTLQFFGAGAAVVVISDAGAARKRYDPLRLLDTLAFFKALRQYTHRYVWLNPLPESYWHSSTAAELARHIPMLSFNQRGMYEAVNVLRGQPFFVESPL